MRGRVRGSPSSLLFGLSSSPSFIPSMPWSHGPFASCCASFVAAKPMARRRSKRVVIVGFDGMDPVLANRFMDEGKLPNLTRLRTVERFVSCDDSRDFSRGVVHVSDRSESGQT